MRASEGGVDHHGIAHMAMANLAELLHAQGEANEAEALYCEALGGRRRTLGETHPATLQLVETLKALRADRTHGQAASAHLKP